MKKITAGGKQFEAELFVFDKDGLLFESRQFWIGLSYARIRAFQKFAEPQLILDWLYFMGIDAYLEHESIVVRNVDPSGILAVASPTEEISVTAGFISEHLHQKWTSAREMAREIFAVSDDEFSLQESIRPRKGFPEIFKRLRSAGIPYGIATSDTLRRAKESIDMYDDFHQVSFVITPQDVQKGKPDPEMLQHISKLTGIDVKHIVMIGDSYVDVQMADAAGAIGIGIPENAEMAKKMQPFATVIIDSLDHIIF